MPNISHHSRTAGNSNNTNNSQNNNNLSYSPSHHHRAHCNFISSQNNSATRTNSLSSLSTSSLSSSSNSPITNNSNNPVGTSNAVVIGPFDVSTVTSSEPPPPYFSSLLPSESRISTSLTGSLGTSGCNTITTTPVSSSAAPHNCHTPNSDIVFSSGQAIQLPQYSVHSYPYPLPPYSSAVDPSLISLTPQFHISGVLPFRCLPAASTFFSGGPTPSIAVLQRVSSGSGQHRRRHHHHHSSSRTSNRSSNHSLNSSTLNTICYSQPPTVIIGNSSSSVTASEAGGTVSSSSSSSATTTALNNTLGGAHSSSTMSSTSSLFSASHHGYHQLHSTSSAGGGANSGAGPFSSTTSAAAFVSSGHHHHHHHHRRLMKQRERNLLSAVVSMLVIVVLCTALVEPNWIAVSGGGCKEKHLGVYQFFYPGYFLDQQSAAVANINSGIRAAGEVLVPGDDGRPSVEVNGKVVVAFGYKYGPSSDDVLVDCITLKGVWLMKSIIVFTFLAIICSVCSFFLDLLGPTQKALKLIHRNAIPSITTVIICVLINGLCYLLTIEVKDLQMLTKPYPGNRISVTFSISFYLIATAGGLAVLGTACNCLRHYPVRMTNSDPEPLLDDYDRLEQVFYPPGPIPEIASMTPMVPPPAYSP